MCRDSVFEINMTIHVFCSCCCFIDFHPIMYVPSICCLIFLKECKTWLHFLSLKENENEFLETILIKIYISCA